MKGIAFFIAFSLVTVVIAGNGEAPPGGAVSNTDHSDVEKILKQNLHLMKNAQGKQETGLTFVRVEESSHQIVAGIIYKAKVIFSDQAGDLYRLKLEIFEGFNNDREITVQGKEKV